MLDELDKKIIMELQRDSRKSFTEIGKKYGVSSQTISDRLDKLRDSGVITHMTLFCDPKKLGGMIRFLVGISLELSKRETTYRELKKIDTIHSIYLTTGEYDVFCLGIANDIEELGRLIERVLPDIEGVQKTITFIVTEEYKHTYERYF